MLQSDQPVNDGQIINLNSWMPNIKLRCNEFILLFNGVTFLEFPSESCLYFISLHPTEGCMEMLCSH